MNPGEKFSWVERIGKAVVRPQLQREDAIQFLNPTHEHDDWNAHPGA